MRWATRSRRTPLPAVVEVIIDKSEPELILGKADLETKELEVEVFDVVSPARRCRAALRPGRQRLDRVALGGGCRGHRLRRRRQRSPCRPATKRATWLRLRAAGAAHSRSSRTRPWAAATVPATAACPGSGQSSTSQYAGGLVGLLFGFGFFLRRRRNQSAKALRGKAEAVVRRSGARGLLKASSLAALSLTLTGCGCSDSEGGDTGPCQRLVRWRRRVLRVERAVLAVPATRVAQGGTGPEQLPGWPEL